MMTSATFSGRAYVSEGVLKLQIWNDEFEPMEWNKRSVTDWVEEHFRMLDEQFVRELLELPQEGNFQCVFHGKIKGWLSPLTEEYDEEVVIDNARHMEIPEAFLSFLEGEEIHAEH